MYRTLSTSVMHTQSLVSSMNALVNIYHHGADVSILRSATNHLSESFREKSGIQILYSQRNVRMALDNLDWSPHSYCDESVMSVTGPPNSLPKSYLTRCADPRHGVRMFRLHNLGDGARRYPLTKDEL